MLVYQRVSTYKWRTLVTELHQLPAAMALGRRRLQLLPALLQVPIGTTWNGAEVHQHHVQWRLGMDPGPPLIAPH